MTGTKEYHTYELATWWKETLETFKREKSRVHNMRIKGFEETYYKGYEDAMKYVVEYLDVKY